PRLSPAERGRKVLEQARANEAEVRDILTPNQQARLRQIGLQAEGPGAFRDPEVAAVLRLNAEQRQRIRDLEDEALFDRLKAMRPGTPPPGLKDGSTNERILAVLTDEQARRWREMTGGPVKGPLIFFPPPPPTDPKKPSRDGGGK